MVGSKANNPQQAQMARMQVLDRYMNPVGMTPTSATKGRFRDPAKRL